jgi:hypothetical protein
LSLEGVRDDVDAQLVPLVGPGPEAVAL